MIRLGLVLCAVGMGCATAPVVVEPDPPLPPGTMVVVAATTTPRALAAAQGLPLWDMCEVNGVRADQLLQPGDVMFVPAKLAAVPAAMAATPAPTPTTRPAPVAPVRTVAPVASPTPVARVAVPMAAVGVAPMLPAVVGALTMPVGAGWRWPVDGIVVREFATKGRNAHDGVLMAAPADSVVMVAKGGQVAYAGNQGTTLGNLVIVEHNEGMASVYAHLSRIDVRVGERVNGGDAIGIIGNSGLVGSSSQLYFEVRKARSPIDPLSVLQAP